MLKKSKFIIYNEIVWMKAKSSKINSLKKNYIFIYVYVSIYIIHQAKGTHTV